MIQITVNKEVFDDEEDRLRFVRAWNRAVYSDLHQRVEQALQELAQEFGLKEGYSV